MARRKVSGAKLKALRSAWQHDDESIAAIARRHGIHAKTLTRYARENDWPGRKSTRAAIDPAEALHHDLMRDLRASLERLRPTGTESAAEARDRLALIRLYQRSLTVLLEIERPGKADRLTGPEPLDYPAAYQRALAWLDHLAGSQSRP